MTWWHITFGTYGTRLHGDARLTVDSNHNQPGEPFVQPDSGRRSRVAARMSARPVYLSRLQREQTEAALQACAAAHGWPLIAAAAAPDHIHILIEMPQEEHGTLARRLLKRDLNALLGTPKEAPRWWAKGGSTKAVTNDRYRVEAERYIRAQATLQQNPPRGGAARS